MSKETVQLGVQAAIVIGTSTLVDEDEHAIELCCFWSLMESRNIVLSCELLQIDKKGNDACAPPVRLKKTADC